MTTIETFLLARIAEDEAVAQAAGHGCGYLHEHNAGWVEVEFPEEHNCRPTYDWRHVKRMSPRRVIAECQAKRRIVERAAAVGALMPAEHLAQGILATLALPYSDHRDYMIEWAPEGARG